MNDALSIFLTVGILFAFIIVGVTPVLMLAVALQEIQILYQLASLYWKASSQELTEQEQTDRPALVKDARIGAVGFLLLLVFWVTVNHFFPVYVYD